MRLLDRYVLYRFLSSFLIVLSIFLILFFVMNIVNELRHVGHGDYHFFSALVFVLLTLPHELDRFSPIIFMMSGLVLFSRLVQYHELLAMTCFGISLRRVLGVCMSAVLVLSMLLLAGAEWWTPNLIRYAHQYKQMQVNRGQVVATPFGTWLHVDQAYLHIQHILSHDQLQDVTLYQFDAAQRDLKFAEYARAWKLERGKWHVFDAKRTVFLPREVVRQPLSHYVSPVNLDAQLLTIGVMDASDFSLKELQFFSAYLQKNHINTSEYHYFFWMKLFQPWIALCMVVFSLFFVLKQRTRTGLGFRLMIGVLFGIMFFLITNFLGQLTVVYQWHPLYSALLIPILCGAGFFKLFKQIK